MKRDLVQGIVTAVVIGLAVAMLKNWYYYGPLRTEEAQITFAYVPARTWHGVSPNHVPETRLAVLRGSNLHVTLDGDQGEDAWTRFDPGQTVFVQYRERIMVRFGETNVIGFRVERVLSEEDVEKEHRSVAGAMYRMESAPESALQCWMFVEKRATDKAFDDAIAGKFRKDVEGFGITNYWHSTTTGPTTIGTNHQ